MASGDKSQYGRENHHIFSNKSKTFTPQYTAITDAYDLDLRGDWNTVMLEGHRGRHTNDYHMFMLDMISVVDGVAKGNQARFLKGVSYLKTTIKDNAWLPYAKKK